MYNEECRNCGEEIENVEPWVDFACPHCGAEFEWEMNCSSDGDETHFPVRKSSHE